mmetsp:Transcript_11162/g.20619  ORF Transcript_11162/g.20619 Transcript_11162/m.20619 type:complete len:243 (+) Transcript_11162:119-847(+)
MGDVLDTGSGSVNGAGNRSASPHLKSDAAKNLDGEQYANAAEAAANTKERREKAIEKGLVMAPKMVPAAQTVFEVSAHVVPSVLKRDVAEVFSDPASSGALALDQLKIIPTIQHTILDILAVNQATADEKDLCLERFSEFARVFCKFLLDKGNWADYCDPCSGLPMYSNGNTVYSEIQGLEKVRRFYTTNAGACRIALHPEWGSNMYPASIFTTAAGDDINAAIEYASKTTSSTNNVSLQGK